VVENAHIPDRKRVSFLTEVTPISKILSMMLFILLPFGGFYLGMRYQKILCPKPITRIERVSTNQEPSPDVQDIFLTKDIISESFPENWSKFDFPEMKFSINYPTTIDIDDRRLKDKREIVLTYKGKYQGNNQGWVDGICMYIYYHELNQENLKDIATGEYSRYEGRVSWTPKKVVVGNTEGYQLGSLESEKSEIGNVAYLYLYLYAGDNGYLEIDTIVMDSRNEGYLNLAKQLLSSIEVTK